MCWSCIGTGTVWPRKGRDGRVVGWKEAEWWDQGCWRGGWMAGAAAAVCSLTCAPAPCGLFPASSCGASRPQHPPLRGLRNWADWPSHSQICCFSPLIQLSLHSAHVHAGLTAHFLKLWGGFLTKLNMPIHFSWEKSTIFKEVAVTFDHMWSREMQVVLSCFPFELRLL